MTQVEHYPNRGVALQTSNWLRVTALVLCSCFVVRIEPAPFDVALTLMAGSFFYAYGLPQRALSEALTWAILLYLSAQIPGFLFATDTERAFIYAAVTLYLVIGAIFIASLTSKFGSQTVLLFAAGYFGAILMTVAAVVADRLGLLDFREIIYYDFVRLQGFFKDPNVLGPAAVPGVLLALPMARDLIARGLPRIPTMAVAVFCQFASAVLVYLSYSRGAWLSALIGLVVSASIGALLRPNAIRVAIAATAVVAASFASMAPSFIASVVGYVSENDEFLIDRIAGGRLQSYDEDRFQVQAMLLGESLNNPLGHGPGQTEEYLREYSSTISGSVASHSSYVRVLFESGVLGAITYAAVLLITLQMAWRVAVARGQLGDYGRALLGCHVALLISAVAIDTIHWRHFWVISGLIWGVHALIRGSSRT